MYLLAEIFTLLVVLFTSNLYLQLIVRTVSNNFAHNSPAPEPPLLFFFIMLLKFVFGINGLSSVTLLDLNMVLLVSLFCVFLPVTAYLDC